MEAFLEHHFFFFFFFLFVVHGSANKLRVRERMQAQIGWLHKQENTCDSEITFVY